MSPRVVRQWVTALAAASGLVGVLVVLGLLSGPTSTARPLATEAESEVFVHLFEWRWQDIATECETVLGPSGVRAVQISPPQEHIVLPDWDFPWWQRYQPISYQLESRSGSRAELVEMVQRCRRAGVAIYADAVINHMAGMESGIGSAGTVFTKYDYPGLYGPEDFNICRQPVVDYHDAANVTQCELVGLADLDTSSPRVQAIIVDYLSTLADLGIQGFRIDAAKHIRAEELGQIIAKFRALNPGDFYIYQEVIDPGTEAIRKQEYYPHGHVIDFKYGQFVSESFLGLNGHTLANLETLGESWGLAPSEQAVVFIDNHDKQRGHGGGGNYLTHQDGDRYTLANVFMLAFPYGRPQIMSSYAFADSDQGPPTYPDGTTRAIHAQGQDGCFGDWVCEHRWPAIANMVNFRRATQSVFAVTDWWSQGDNQIAFGRGDRGFVVINNDTTDLTHTFQTQLPAGTYCNVIADTLATITDPCPTGSEAIIVDDQGQFTATVAPQSALAIHIEARHNSLSGNHRRVSG